MPATKHGHDPDVEITPAEIEALLRPPPHFAYWGDDKDTMFVTWTLGPGIRHRESDLIQKSNALVLIKHLEADPSLADDWRITNTSCSMVGWIDHLSYRVKEADGSPTRIARVIKAFYDALDDYPIADEDHHSALVAEADGEWLSAEGPREADRMGFVLPEDWFGKVLDWWDAHDQGATEDKDGNGASPSSDQWRAAFEGCGFAREAE